jgi:hypothetical protein
LTNGAALTTVPTAGPVAAYFQHGAEVTAVPGSGPAALYFHNGAEALAYYPVPQTQTGAAPVATVEHGGR